MRSALPQKEESGVTIMENLLKKIYASEQSENKSQYRILQFIKLLALINMLGFYVIYNYHAAEGLLSVWQATTGFIIWQKFSIWTLILSFGMTFTQCSRHLLWGASLVFLGSIITFTTHFRFPDNAVYYGVFTFLGVAMLVVHIFHWWLKKAPGSCGWLLCAIAYDLTRHLTDGVIVWQGKVIGHVASVLYNGWMTWLGFPDKTFSSLEYVPFLPNIFLFLCGVYLFQFMTEHEKGRYYLEKLR